MLGRGAHVTSPRLKPLNFLGMSVIDKTFHVLLSLVAGGIKPKLGDSTERRLLEAYTWLPSALLHVPFVLCPFAGAKP